MKSAVYLDIEDTPELGESASADAELIAATRAGDAAAFGQLYLRHVQAAARLSRILSKDRATADDLVSETFERVLAALRAGKGPDLAFRAYLLTTMRNCFYSRTKRDRRVEYTDDLTPHDPGEAFVDPAIAEQERHFAARAFKRLPERWQMILWHTEVEGDTAAQIAKHLGLTPNGVSALAYRARERLKEMYLREHIQEPLAASCKWTTDRLSAKVRGGLSTRDTTKVDNHLVGCAACKYRYMELTEINSGIGVILAPIFLGLAAPAYLGLSALKWGAIGVWFGGVVEGLRNAVGAVRQFFQQFGGRNTALAGGATAVVAAVLALLLLADDGAEPPADAAPATEPTVEAPADEPGDPTDPDPESPSEPADDPSEPADPVEYSIEVDPSDIGLTAGVDGSLPITLTAPDGGTPRVPTWHGRAPVTELAGPHARVAPDRLTLRLTLPEGISSPGGDATDGWNCEKSAPKVTCTRERLRPGQSTTALVPIAIEDSVSGFQEVEAHITTANGATGSSVLRFPVSPPSTTTAFAATDATGVANTGNTLLSCRPALICGHQLTDNHFSIMKPYKAEGAPDGAGDDAVSGATLSIPAGAEVLWAGVYWTASEYETPAKVRLAGPGGGWSTVSEQRAWDGAERPVRQSAATVTDLVRGSGTYWFAADPDALPSGVHHYAGWSLTVVYREAGAPTKETAVYEGLAQPRNGGSLTLAIPGGEVDVAYTLWDGDKTLRGDTMLVGGTVVCGGDNLGSSRSPGALEGPNWHTFGVDVDVCRARARAEPTTLTIAVGRDPMEIGVLAVSTMKP
ncbi:sigma-70 family RNA polymerase sigma factor [Stackebrandtia soli]|uniref:sigma-70 family RNA polymerase sigma factor n=1 Tax=Stackebrandtia soli TaxID=1892856 RepID=UPI0039EB4F2C